ncbi:MAG: hypothetical protein E6R03_10470, partial [Hyphomicrobiaceae bacterium]
MSTQTVFIYIPARTEAEIAANPRYAPIAVDGKVTQVWSMAAGRHDSSYIHDPQAPLTHGVTGWLEDVGHDWSFRNGKLQYSPGGERCGGIWLAVKV